MQAHARGYDFLHQGTQISNHERQNKSSLGNGSDAARAKGWCGKPACTFILRTMLVIPVLRLPSSTASSNQPTQNTMVNARFSGHRMIVESHRKKSSFLVPFFSFLLNSVANNVEKTWVSQGVEASNLVKVIQAQQLSAGRGQTCGSL